MKRFKKWIKDNIGWEGLVLIVILIVLVRGVFSAIRISQTDIRSRNLCIQNGYPNVLKSSGIRYCHRLENGNDVIVPVKSLGDNKKTSLE